jgi:hypothetical protein
MQLVVSPSAKVSAIRRFRFDSVESQLAKSSRVAAVLAGVERRSATRT